MDVRRQRRHAGVARADRAPARRRGSRPRQRPSPSGSLAARAASRSPRLSLASISPGRGRPRSSTSQRSPRPARCAASAAAGTAPRCARRSRGGSSVRAGNTRVSLRTSTSPARQQRGQLGEDAILELAAAAPHDQQPRRVARLRPASARSAPPAARSRGRRASQACAAARRCTPAHPARRSPALVPRLPLARRAAAVRLPVQAEPATLARSSRGTVAQIEVDEVDAVRVGGAPRPAATMRSCRWYGLTVSVVEKRAKPSSRPPRAAAPRRSRRQAAQRSSARRRASTPRHARHPAPRPALRLHDELEAGARGR